ncbi:MAG: hypothetical protein ACOX16_01755 [Candidatus Izemoplasmatales bacterium]|jgi:hypothetical protein
MVNIKKALACFLVVTLSLLTVAFLAKETTIKATGGQQTAESVELTLVSYFDQENTITSVFEIPEEGTRWFDESTDKLHVYTSGAWDAGTAVPVVAPEMPSTGDMWFDEAKNTLYTYLAEGWDAGEVLPTAEPDLKYGQKLSLNSSLASMPGYSFLFWEVNGSIRHDYAIDHVFTLTKTNVIKAVFSPSDRHAVVFVDANSEILKVEYVADNGTATPPETLPSKPGYSTNGWDVSYENVTDDVVTVLQYTATDTTEYLVTVENGTGDGSYAYNTVATVTADVPSQGNYFHHWSVGDEIVSYQSTYKFSVYGATTITAVYEGSAPSDNPYVVLGDDLAIRSGSKTYVGQFYVPTGYTLIEYGILTSISEAEINLDTIRTTRYPGYKYNAATKEFVMSFEENEITAARAYLICSDSEDAIHTYYSGHRYSSSIYQVKNGGFEFEDGAITGSLDGWYGYNIWKNEKGMQSFLRWDDGNGKFVNLDDRVVNTTYFDNHPYNRDGSYNLGITWPGGSWDQTSERMGHLRSSNFTLGGSGWISFKLGGGKSSSFAFVSVRRASDNYEVARFGNKNYNNTAIASAQYGSAITNAEAFLFQYYYDLSEYLGTELYFLITESSSKEWCILSADSFVTYYPIAPSTDSDTLATNILPTIYNAGSSTNQLANNLNGNVNNWGNPNNVFRWDDGAGRTNAISGDNDLGVARSSAFNINGPNTYLWWQWEGNISQDKQLFISIKEVGTNIEVLRLVRRDNLSGKTGGGFDNHWFDLSGLDAGKEYYVELCDNLTIGWGLISIKDIYLAQNNQSDKVGSAQPNDVAVSISGIETEFAYEEP